ncbi:MAG TPA: DUF2600 family protein [Solirubrobacterales bacterium]|nr:DUF2600 family protein [Solirubrobacterales bacterium]
MRRVGKEIGAAVGALGAYLLTVMPAARRELRRWGPLPEEKVRNAEAVAVFATLAPRSARPAAVRMIVTLQVALDRRDELEETGGEIDAAESAELERLEASWRRDIAMLPSQGAVSPLLEHAVERCREGQRKTHGAAAGDGEGLRRWAESLAAPAGYRWWELAAGASSSVAAHALIAAAAAPDTSGVTAARIDAAYFPPIGALTVLLDDLVDWVDDRAAGEHNYLDYYVDASAAAERLGLIAERAAAQVEQLPRAARHRAILAGVGAFYLGDGAETAFQPIRARLIKTLGPGGRILVWFLRLRRASERKRPGQEGDSPGP